MFWEVTLNGKHLFYFRAKNKKFDFGMFYLWLIDYGLNPKNFSIHSLIIKPFKIKDTDIDFNFKIMS